MIRPTFLEAYQNSGSYDTNRGPSLLQALTDSKVNLVNLLEALSNEKKKEVKVTIDENSSYPLLKSVSKKDRQVGEVYVDTMGRHGIWNGTKLNCLHDIKRSTCKECR